MRDKRLVIKTDKYTGNFERELVGYCFGRLSEEQEKAGYGREFVRAFWQNFSTCNDFEEYKKKEEEHTEFARLMKRADKLLGNSCVVKATLITMEDIYNDYFEYKREEVDDDYEETYYSINDKEISIWLQQELPGKFLQMFVQRIKSFFENNVLEVFENAIYLTKFDSLCHCDNKVKLLDLYYEDNGVRKDV